MIVRNSNIGKIIKYHRKKASLTQLELAELASVGKTVIFDLEKGKQTIKLSTLTAVLEALNISLALEGPLIEQSIKDLNL